MIAAILRALGVSIDDVDPFQSLVGRVAWSLAHADEGSYAVRPPRGEQ
jgi:hypothetical protein